MHRFLFAMLLAATAGGALADAPVPADEAATRAGVADQAALEVDEEPAHVGPTFGKSRVERRREKCRSQAHEQGLTGDALRRHMQTCVKR